MHRLSNSLIAVIFLFLTFNVSTVKSQETQNLYKPDPRLYECMSKVYVDQLSSEKSELILYYNYYLENSYCVISLKSEKPITGTDIHTVTIKDENNSVVKHFSETEYTKNSFNPLKYNFNRSLNSYTIYVWKEAGVAIEFIPMRYFQSQFQNILKENNLN
jgi:hypothetical protein